MNITKEEYTINIKPLLDGIYNLSGKLTVAEEVMVGDLLLELADKEFKFEDLKKRLTSLTKLQIEFFNNKGLTNELEIAQKFLANA